VEPRLIDQIFGRSNALVGGIAARELCDIWHFWQIRFRLRC